MATTPAARPSTPSGSGARVTAAVGVPLLVAAVVAAVLAGLSTTDSLELLGIPDPGTLTTAGLPAVRAMGELLLTLAIGSAVFATFFTPPQRDKTLDVDGYRAQRISAHANMAWAVCAVLLIPLTLSDVSGRPLSRALAPDQWVSAMQIDVASSWRWAALLALVAAIGQRITLSWRWSVVWLAVTTLAIVPIAATGHSAASGAHDMATNSLLIHLLAATWYVGGLLAVVLHVLAGGGRQVLALRRFSVVATVAIAALAISGLVNTAVRLSPGELLGSTYGLLVVAKAVALVVLGLCGLAMRRRVLSRFPDGTGAAERLPVPVFLRLAGIEVVVMAATVALAVSLGRTPPPAPRYQPGIQEALLGFQLPGPPSAATLLLHWRFDLILGTAAVLAAALYIWGVVRLRRDGVRWPPGRTVAWLCGCAALLATTSSGLGMYMMGEFSLHMVGHMSLSMLVPVLLCLGGPLTLALRALPAAGRAKPPGPREWLVEFINNPVSRFLTNPVVAAVQFVVGFYVVYLAGLYDSLVSDHMGHLFMNVHFLISGYVFYWVIIGVDAAPRHHPPVYKLLALVGSLPFHAFFGILLINWKDVLGQTWYSSLALPWVPDLLRDQQVGGGVAWAAGELPLFLVMVALGMQWFTSDMREARRGERQAERDSDAELRAYNEMLRQMSGGRGED